MKKLLELLFLKQIKGIGSAFINKHINDVEQSDGIDNLIESINLLEGRGNDDIDLAKEKAEKKFDAITHQDRYAVITVFDKEYPKGFESLGNKRPVIIYVRGDTSILNNPGVSVVGTRKPSIWSQMIGANIAKNIGEISGRIIVSGLALGCDRLAHEGAMAVPVPTIAILPSGINIITPASHRELAEKIIDAGGCLLSEYEPDAKAFRMSFVERDSLIAAMTEITCVIECEEKSGTMHTVRAAKKMERKLLCYYPRENDIQADIHNYAGNKLMIDTMGAKPISNKEELKDYFSTECKSNMAAENPKQMTITDYVDGNDQL